MWKMGEEKMGQSNGGKMRTTVTEQQLIKNIKYNKKELTKNYGL